MLQLHTLILINMGIRYDLPTTDWFGDLDPKVTIHVIDSARPQSLVNLFMGGESGERVLVWDDGDADKMEEERKSWEVIEVHPAPNSCILKTYSRSMSPDQIPTTRTMARFLTRVTMPKTTKTKNQKHNPVAEAP